MSNKIKCKCCNRPFLITAIVKKDLLCKPCRSYLLYNKFKNNEKLNTRTCI